MEIAATPTTPTASSTPPAPPASSTTEAAPWYAGLPADLAADPTISKYTSLEAAARGLSSAVKMIGEKPENLAKLPAGGDEAATRALLHKLGLPESAEGYKLSAFEGAPEGVTPDSDLAKVFSAAAFEAGVLPQHAQKVFEKVGAFLGEVQKQEAVAREGREAADMQALESKFGGALDDTLTRAEVVANHFKVTEALNAAGLGTNPGVVELLASVFPMLQEDSAGGRQSAALSAGAKTPEAYLAEARELQRQAIAEKSRSRQLELSQAASRLYQLANAGRR